MRETHSNTVGKVDNLRRAREPKRGGVRSPFCRSSEIREGVRETHSNAIGKIDNYQLRDLRAL